MRSGCHARCERDCRARRDVRRDATPLQALTERKDDVVGVRKIPRRCDGAHICLGFGFRLTSPARFRKTPNYYG